MKKLLLVLIVAFAFCGSKIAQAQAPWEGMPITGNYHTDVMAYVAIDGQIITANDNYETLEVAYFIGEDFKGSVFVDDAGDPNPTAECIVKCFIDEPGQEITFKMFDHSTGTLYETCTPSQPCVTGTDHYEIWDEDYDNAVVLYFTSPATEGFTRDITPWTKGGDYYLVASPVGQVNPEAVDNMISPNDYDLYYFDQSQEKEWINYKGDDENNLGGFNLEIGKGYLYANAGDGDQDVVTLTFNGDAYTNADGKLTLDLDYSESAEAGLKGFNLIGNPFAVEATVNRPFYTMNGGTNFIPNDAMAVLPAMEGAFVVAEGTGETVEIEAQAGGKGSSLALNLTNNGKVIDRAIVSFGQKQQLPKFQLDENNTKVYIPQDGTDYALVSSNGIGEMPVNFKAQKAGSYTFTASSLNAQFNYLHLIDNLTGNDVDLLANPSYSFNATTTDYASRFRLVFATGNSDDNSFASYYNGNVIVSNEGAAVLNIVDVLGRTISSQNINGSENISINAKAGVYTLQLIQGDNVKTQKIVVK